MTSIQESVDVRAPLRDVYDQWTQFEEFPRFMATVDRVRQVDPAHTAWTVTIGGATRDFDAEITEQRPDERIAWRSLRGPAQGGAVTFHRLDDHTTRVHLQMEYEPGSLPEQAGARLGIVGRRISGELRRFRDFIEGRGEPTGAWRGEIPRPARSREKGGARAADRGGTAALSNPPTASAGDGVLAEQHRRDHM